MYGIVVMFTLQGADRKERRAMIEVSVVLITAHVIAYFMLKSDDREIQYSWRTSRKVIAFFMLRSDSPTGTQYLARFWRFLWSGY